MENLSDSQKSWAAALPIKPATDKQVKESANDNGVYIKRAHSQKIVEMGIAKETNEFGKILISRGPQWQKFWQIYGREITERELFSLKIQEDLAEIFGSLAT